MYRSHVLVCGGTGCTSSGSQQIIQTLEQEIAKNGLENEIKVVNRLFWPVRARSDYDRVSGGMFLLCSQTGGCSGNCVGASFKGQDCQTPTLFRNR